jgi:hypothetical protein
MKEVKCIDLDDWVTLRQGFWGVTLPVVVAGVGTVTADLAAILPATGTGIVAVLACFDPGGSGILPAFDSIRAVGTRAERKRAASKCGEGDACCDVLHDVGLIDLFTSPG